MERPFRNSNLRTTHLRSRWNAGSDSGGLELAPASPGLASSQLTPLLLVLTLCFEQQEQEIRNTERTKYQDSPPTP